MLRLVMIPPIYWHASATQATLMKKNGLNSVKHEPAVAAAFAAISSAPRVSLGPVKRFLCSAKAAGPPHQYCRCVFMYN